MTKTLRLLMLPIVAISLLLFGITAANASTTKATNCGDQDLASGVYNGLVVTGMCTIPDDATVVINGRVVIEGGGYLNARTLAQVTINGNIRVQSMGVLDLGCTVIGLGCAADSHDVVRGNIRATDALVIYLDGNTIYGNVTSTGGGVPPACDGNNPIGRPLNFSIKDNTFYGKFSVDGWQGCWLGYIRNSQHGKASITNNVAANPDSTEVASSYIWGTLRCSGNTPPAQIGDSGGSLNVVHGKATGECASLVQ